jgi:hypothetical protein
MKLRALVESTEKKNDRDALTVVYSWWSFRLFCSATQMENKYGPFKMYSFDADNTLQENKICHKIAVPCQARGRSFFRAIAQVNKVVHQIGCEF